MKPRHIWRTAGLVLVGSAGLLAILGAYVDWAAWPLWAFAAYWGFFLLFFVGSLYCVFLDLRFTAAEYAAQRRQVFRETLGDETFRRALRAAQQATSGEQSEDR